MEIDWTSDEVAKGRATVQQCVGQGAQIFATDLRAMMSGVVSLFLARASGQVKEDVTTALSGVPDGPGGDAEREAVYRLSALAQEAEALRAKVEELEEQRDHARDISGSLKTALDGARAEVEKWKSFAAVQEMDAAAARSEAAGAIGRLAAMDHRLNAAESRLAAIRERGAEEVARMESSDLYGAAARLRWVLEGDAPQDFECPHNATTDSCGTCNEYEEQSQNTVTPEYAHGDNIHAPQEAKPVEECLCAMRSVEVIATATPDPYDWGRSDGIEAMRAACLRDVLAMYRKQDGCVTEQDLKAAIEGAIP